MKRTKSKQIIALLVVLIIATGLSVAGGDQGVTFGSISVFALCAIIAFSINWLAFIPANMAQTERYFDVVGSLTYLTVIATAVMLVPELSVRAKLAAIMVAVWAIRLGTFLFVRISKDGHDDRFDEIKVAPLRFFMTWTLQGLWVLFTAACALAIITGGNAKPIGVIGSIGLLMWLVGFIIESVADAQKRAFKRNPNNKGRFINQGLWAWSRHPNYFGEILLWSGMAVLAIPVLVGWQWVTLVSPIFVFLLLTRLSGIPTLTKKAKERWGNDADYQAYVSKTSLLFPRPPKS